MYPINISICKNLSPLTDCETVFVTGLRERLIHISYCGSIPNTGT